MKRFVSMVLVSLVLLVVVSPAYACACSEYGTAEGFVGYWNSLPYEARSTYNTMPPAGYAFDPYYYMVPLY